MRLLTRYLIRQNVFLLGIILLMGTGLYVLTDLFERLDNFLIGEAGMGTILLFFLVKLPSIISAILPAVYLIAMVVQMNMLERSRELTALNAGGISSLALVRFVLFYGFIWALGQFVFAQVLGVEGERSATRIWQEEVRGSVLEEARIGGLWFTERNHIVHIGEAYPVQRRGNNILVYGLDATGVGIDFIIKAERFTIKNDESWLLENGGKLVPAEYSTTAFASLELPLTQDLRAFQVRSHSGNVRPNQLSLLELSDTIQRLERAGSNVESLRTAWHGKLAYAGSILVMGLLALLVTRLTDNIYKAIVLSLIIVFFYYGANTISASMADKGIIIPLAGAWFANAFFFLVSAFCLVWPGLRRRLWK